MLDSGLLTGMSLMPASGLWGELYRFLLPEAARLMFPSLWQQHLKSKCKPDFKKIRTLFSLIFLLSEMLHVYSQIYWKQLLECRQAVWWIKSSLSTIKGITIIDTRLFKQTFLKVSFLRVGCLVHAPKCQRLVGCSWQCHGVVSCGSLLGQAGSGGWSHTVPVHPWRRKSCQSHEQSRTVPPASSASVTVCPGAPGYLE